jgi:hypothetical protein
LANPVPGSAAAHAVHGAADADTKKRDVGAAAQGGLVRGAERLLPPQPLHALPRLLLPPAQRGLPPRRSVPLHWKLPALQPFPPPVTAGAPRMAARSRVVPSAREIVDVWAHGVAAATVLRRVTSRWIEVRFGLLTPLNYYPLNPLESCSKAQLADRPLKSNGKLPSRPSYCCS